MLVLARVRSSTRLTITAQAVDGPGWPFFSGLAGSVPGTLPAKPLKNGQQGPATACAVIVKRVDERTRAKTSINELLRD